MSTAGFVGLVLALSVAGCSSSNNSGSTPSVSASASASKASISLGADWELELTDSSTPLATWPSDVGAPEDAELLATGFATQLGANSPVQYQATQYRVNGTANQVISSQKALLTSTGWTYQKGDTNGVHLFSQPNASLRVAATPIGDSNTVYLYQWTDSQMPTPAVP